MAQRRWGLCLCIGLFSLAVRCGSLRPHISLESGRGFNLVGTSLRSPAQGRRPHVERRIETYDAFENMGNPFDAL